MVHCKLCILGIGIICIMYISSFIFAEPFTSTNKCICILLNVSQRPLPCSINPVNLCNCNFVSTWDQFRFYIHKVVSSYRYWQWGALWCLALALQLQKKNIHELRPNYQQSVPRVQIKYVYRMLYVEKRYMAFHLNYLSIDFEWWTWKEESFCRDLWIDIYAYDAKKNHGVIIFLYIYKYI